MILVPSCILCISLFLVPVPSAVGFRTLLTFDSPLPGIKYSWAPYTALLRGTLASSSKPSRDFESFIALARPAKHFRALRFESESRDECNGVAVELCCFPRATETFAFYYVFGSASVSAQLSRNCHRKLSRRFRSRVNLVRSKSRRVASKKIRTEIDFFCTRKGKRRNQHFHDTTRKLLG